MPLHAVQLVLEYWVGSFSFCPCEFFLVQILTCWLSKDFLWCFKQLCIRKALFLQFVPFNRNHGNYCCLVDCSVSGKIGIHPSWHVSQLSRTITLDHRYHFSRLAHTLIGHVGWWIPVASILSICALVGGTSAAFHFFLSFARHGLHSNQPVIFTKPVTGFYTLWLVSGCIYDIFISFILILSIHRKKPILKSGLVRFILARLVILTIKWVWFHSKQNSQPHGRRRVAVVLMQATFSSLIHGSEHSPGHL